MLVTWRVINKQARYRLQDTYIPDEKIKACDNVDEAYDLIENIIDKEYQETVYWNFHDNELLIKDINEVFNNV